MSLGLGLECLEIFKQTSLAMIKWHVISLNEVTDYFNHVISNEEVSFYSLDCDNILLIMFSSH